MSRLVYRKIKSGRIKLNGKIWKPQEIYRIYDGRLDGEKMLFSEYEQSLAFQPLVYMYDPENKGVVDGALPWLFWVVDNE